MTARGRGTALAIVASSLVLAACGDDDDGSAQGASFVELDRALGDEVRTTLVTMLYENTGSRNLYLELTEEDHPDVWQEVTADGDVTLPEFRSLPHVQDAVNHHGAEVITTFRDHLAAAPEG
ncbi:MAG: hypothetical protein ACLFXM_10600 [Acidimicrobiia bacterium]